MNVELNLEELEQIVEALNQKHDALSSGGTEVLPELQAVNRLYNRLRELREEHENNHDLSREEVHHAYNRRQLGSAVFISDLANELQIGVPKLHEWIQKEVITAGRGSLDDGHWPTATESQRAAAIEHFGSRRLLIRFSQPDHVAIVKEHDGQVETPQNRNREQDDGADNEIDGEDAMKLYNELVKSPENRLALEKERPSLVAARDQAIVELRREKLQKETAEKPHRVARVRR